MEEYLIKRPCIVCKKDSIHNIGSSLGIVSFCSDECMEIQASVKKKGKMKITEVKVVPDRNLYPASRIAMNDGNNYDET